MSVKAKEEYQEFFDAMHRFRHLRPFQVIPELSGNDHRTIKTIACLTGCSTHPHFKEMPVLEEGVKVNVIARFMHVSAPQISRTLRGLEDKGLIVRIEDPKDRRNTYIKLTEQGVEMVEKTDAVMNEFFHNVFRKMDPAQVKEMTAFFTQLYELSQVEIERLKEKYKKKEDNE